MATQNLNHVVITGNLTSDPELRSLPSGTSVCKLRVAVNTRRKDSSGEWVDKANYFDVTVWGAQGENAATLPQQGPPRRRAGPPRMARMGNQRRQQAPGRRDHRRPGPVPRQRPHQRRPRPRPSPSREAEPEPDPEPPAPAKRSSRRKRAGRAGRRRSRRRRRAPHHDHRRQGRRVLDPTRAGAPAATAAAGATPGAIDHGHPPSTPTARRSRTAATAAVYACGRVPSMPGA